MAIFAQFLIGLIFGLGLIISGMSDPAKVLNFLDLAAIPKGTWDASLVFVMAGAVAVTFVGFRFVFKSSRPIFADCFHLPATTGLDARIVIGPVLFGIGWGMAGFCPGPAFTALIGKSPAAFIFVSAMFTGMVAARWLANRTSSARAKIQTL
ncbi:MAG: YeeE/YedE family protein [Bradyrhizobiaceae bacterium]|nr:MAG: YeeE/YedE family protein [Bradyrhizobiaceae bacterium]